MANGFTIPDELKLNLGKYPNDGTGDDLYRAFDKIRQTFDLINGELGIIDGENVGSGIGIYKAKVDNKIQLKSLTGSSGVTITETDTTVNIATAALVISDTSPTLGGNLSLDGFNVYGAGAPGAAGDIKSTVWDIDIRDLYNQVHTLLTTNIQDLDLGSNWSSTSSNYDLGFFTPIAP